MARNTKPRGKLMRREKSDLFLFSSRRNADSKCKLSNLPGQHGSSQIAKTSNYGMQLREKQKIRRIYGVLERQFRKYFAVAEKKKGNTGDNLLQILESTLYNVVYRMGFASTRAEARQLVSHRSIWVNGGIVNIPSYSVSPGDVIGITEKSKSQVRIMEALSLASQNGFPAWIETNISKLEGIFKNAPAVSDIANAMNVQSIVEFYSK